MLAHVLMDAVQILEETYVAQLVYLVVADGLHGQLLADILQVIRGSRDTGYAGTREADLGGRAEFIHDIRISGLLTLSQNLNQEILIVVIKMMHAVSVVPVDAEVFRGGFEPRETAHRLVRVSDSLGIGILRHAPDTFDGRIGAYQLLHHIHIRAGGRHRHIDHLDPKIFGNRKVAVVARNGTEEFHLVQLAPGRAAHNAMGHGSGHSVIHHVQAGVAIDNDLIRGDLGHSAQKLLRFLYAVQHAIIPAVHALGILQVRSAVQHVHHSHGKIQLLCAGLASGHIQVQIQGLRLAVLRVQLCFQRQQFFLTHLTVRFHNTPPHLFCHFF